MYEELTMDETLEAGLLPTNAEIARTLFQIGSLLELIECNPFRVRAYRRAALAVLFLPRQAIDYVSGGEPVPLPGVGDGLQAKIYDLLNTGHMGVHDTLLEEIGEPLASLLTVEGIGPKTAIRLVSELQVQSLHDVARAAEEHRIQALRGFGPKREQRIAQAIQSAIAA
jgi:DNA polymerase (family 10)